MRFIKYLFLAIVGVALLTMALANRQTVTLSLAPTELAELLPFQTSLNLPLFLVIFAGIVLGLFIGFVWEYLREYKHRRDVGVQKREVNRLEREVKGLRASNGGEKDEILALLE